MTRTLHRTALPRCPVLGLTVTFQEHSNLSSQAQRSPEGSLFSTSLGSREAARIRETTGQEALWGPDASSSRSRVQVGSPRTGHTVEPGLDSMVGTTVQLAAWLWEEGAPYSLVFPSCSRWHCTVHGLGEANRGHHRRGERPALQGHGLRFHETLVVG